jgi:hypothetical protein
VSGVIQDYRILSRPNKKAAFSEQREIFVMLTTAQKDCEMP